MRPHKTVRPLSLVLAVILLCGCSQISTVAEHTPQSDGAGKRVDTSSIADATPKIEPITRAGNKSPYQVFGKTYFVLPSGKDYSEEGVASWYGTKFHGRKTSNGEIYDMYAMTAAHKSLPIPCYVRVTNLENKRKIVVRVNDRGPFHGPRIIDLSYVAALKLGFADKGTAKVLIETIDPSGSLSRQPTKAEVPTPTEEVASSVAINQGPYLQVGAFGDAASAQSIQKAVRKFTALPILVQQRDNLYKVWVGPIADNMELRLIKRALQQTAGISGFVVNP